jgi:hypothetical protein
LVTGQHVIEVKLGIERKNGFTCNVIQDYRRVASAVVNLRAVGKALALISSQSARARPTQRILGATLWTDYAVAGDHAAAMSAAEREIYDHRLIRRSEGSGFFSPVVPHSAARHPGHGLNELAPAFCSDCDDERRPVCRFSELPQEPRPREPMLRQGIDLVEAASADGVAAWIFGHHHWSLATETHGVRLLSARLGYPGEDTGWTGPGYLEI